MSLSRVAEVGTDSVGLERALRRETTAEIRFDDATRALYSTDASNYRSVPIGVVLPRSTEDVIATVALCRDHDASIVSRGAATSTSGQACGPGVVIDHSRHLNRIIDLDPQTRVARVQPGVILESLQSAALAHGLRVGPDPSTRDRATIGGMLGNNSCGAHSLRFGKTDASVEELDVLTYAGDRFIARELEAMLSSSGRRYADAVMHLLAEHEEDLRAAFGDGFTRRVSGYGLGHLLPERGAHLGRALVGTEGTCVTILEASLRLIEAPNARALLILGFEDLYVAAEHVPALLDYAPSTLEGVGRELLDLARRTRHGAAGAALFPDAGAFLLIEFEGPAEEACALQAQGMLAGLDPRLVDRSTLILDPAAQRAAWRVREEGAGFASRRADGAEAWPGWEDAAVPPDRLAHYLREFDRLLADHGLAAAHYGHYGEGCVHARVDFDFHTAPGVATFRHFVEQAADLVVLCGGSLSGEHGDGQARGELLSRMYPPSIMQAFGQFKSIFDPANRMNPGRLIDALPIDSQLRVGRVPRAIPVTSLALGSDHGNLAAAARRCIGVGKCRADTGGMCPSFQVTRDEQHSTRGRARLLFEMLAGEMIPGGFRSAEVDEALDLCLSCKACKSECPVSVDMASYKAVFLEQRYRGRVRPRAHYLLGSLPTLARVGARVPRLANMLTRQPLARVVRLAGGLGARRLPRFSPRRVRREQRADATALIWPDSFNATFSPQVLDAAVEVIDAIGERAGVLAGPLCCGRTWYSTGQLSMARRVLERSLGRLAGPIASGRPIVVLEPTCAAMLRDEALELLPDDDRARALSTLVRTLDEFLLEHEPLPVHLSGLEVLTQVHCHEAALLGVEPAAELFARLGAGRVRVEQRCCGMAGDFGMRAGHEAISRSIFEHNLGSTLPSLSEDGAVVADGFSCRLQLEDLTGRRALHTAELLQRALGEKKASELQRD